MGMVSNAVRVVAKQSVIKKKTVDDDDVLEQLEASLRDLRAGRVRRVR